MYGFAVGEVLLDRANLLRLQSLKQGDQAARNKFRVYLTCKRVSIEYSKFHRRTRKTRFGRFLQRWKGIGGRLVSLIDWVGTGRAF